MTLYFQITISEASRPEERGSALALGGLGWSLSHFSTPLIMGVVADRYGLVPGFYVLGALALACALADRLDAPLGVPGGLSRLPLPAAELLLALEDAPLDRLHRLDLLAKGFLALVALLVGALPLARARARARAARPLALAQLAGEKRGKTPVSRRRRAGERLQELGRARVVAQGRRQHREQGGEAQAVGRQRGSSRRRPVPRRAPPSARAPARAQP